MGAAVEWDTRPPKDLKADADATQAYGTALQTANQALEPYGLRVDAVETATRFGIVLEKIPTDATTANTTAATMLTW